MFKGLFFFIKFGWKHRKSYIILNIVNQFLTGLLPLVTITMPKFIIDELLGGRRLYAMICYLVVLLLAIFLNSWLVTHINLQIFNQRCCVAAQFSKYMHEKLANTDFRNLEDPQFFEMREKANKFLYGDWHGFSFVMESAFSIVGKLFTLTGIIVIVLTMNLYLMLVFLGIVFLSAFVDAKMKEKSHTLSMEAVHVERRWGYFTKILEDVSFSKEIRMNHISKWLIEKELDYSDQAIQFYKKRNRFSSFSSFFSSASNLLQNAITYAFLIYKVIVYDMTIGNFTMYINAVTSFSNAVRDVLSSLTDIKVYGIYYDALDKYVNIPETLRDNKKLPTGNIEEFVIEFENVCFCYPGQSEYAVKNLNLSITSGMRLAVVGENGAGKTTFIKLLCRLYDPTEGRILLNGVDIKDMDYDEYMDIFSAVFQDFKLFSFSIKDNILFDRDLPEEQEEVEKILKQVGLEKRIKKLKKGMDTAVYKEFDDAGFEPSGGEGQKIAIARAIAKKSRIVILDEPLAALDPKAEYEIFCQFNELVRDKTAIYISHRLSSCRLCDAIAVFDKGSLAEFGSHMELMERNGKYAELYNLQAQYYTD